MYAVTAIQNTGKQWLMIDQLIFVRIDIFIKKSMLHIQGESTQKQDFFY